ncbi:hypothetical protein Gorai_014529, partial [Gossypium raimondii]|nr:hypothetical protein [Gossypium raimondii]
SSHANRLVVLSVPPDSGSIHDNDPYTSQQQILVEDYDLSNISFIRKKMDQMAMIENLQNKFLHLLQRLGQTQDSLLVAKVLYGMHLATLIRVGESNLKRVNLNNEIAESIVRASRLPELDISVKILVLGQTELATGCIGEVVGTVNGIKVTFIDTPGFLPYARRNRKIMLSVKKYIRKPPPDVLYFERLHFINMDCSAFPLLKLLTQQYIHQAVSDSSIEVPVRLVENDPQCKRNILPNGQVWKSQFLLLCICTKVPGDANNLLKLHDGIELGPLTSNQLPSLPSFLRHRLVSDPTEPENGFDEILLSDAEEVAYDQLPPID